MKKEIETNRNEMKSPAHGQPRPEAAFVSGTRISREWLVAAFAILSPLWIAGVAVAVLLLSLVPAIYFASHGSRLAVWIPYLALGTIFPLAIIVALVTAKFGYRLPEALQRLLVVLALAAPLAVAQPDQVLPAVGLAAIQTFVCIGIFKRSSIPLSVAFMAVGTGSWLVILKLFTWDPMPSVYFASWPLLAIGGVSLIGCCWWACRSKKAQGRLLTPVDALASALLILLAFRTDGLFQTDRVAPTGSFYHWGAAVGPAEAVRQGGVLLWDTPSPYGFLLPLVIAAFPAPTAWQSLYVLNAVFTAVLAVGIYLALRARAPGARGALLSLLLSAAVVYFAAMYPPQILPEHYYPMSGAFRYAWCYLLIGVLLLERFATSTRKLRQLVILAGSICWLASVFWSPESAFFGTMIWIPSYALIVVREFHPARLNSRMVAAWLLLPMALLALGIGSLFVTYQARFGHGPDLQAYVEVVLSFGGSRVGQTSGLFGATDFAETALVLAFGVVLFAVAAGIVAGFNDWYDLPLTLGFMFGMWALLAYPVSQPFLFALYRLLPFLVLGVAILFLLIAPQTGSLHAHWVNVLRMMSVPVLTAILATAYGNLPELAYFAQAIRNEPFRGGDVTAGLPNVEASLQQLLNAAHVQPGDPLFFEGTTYGEMLPVWEPSGGPPVTVSRQWLAGPLSAMIYLSDDRKQTYLARAADRQMEAGWLIEPRDRDRLQFSLGPWFYEQVNRTHVPTKFASNDEWQLIWFEPRVDDLGTESSVQDVDWVPGGAESIRVNGKDLPSSVLPAVWGVWGPEWTSAGRIGRCVIGEGTFRVFSASPRKVTLKVKQTGSTPLPLTIRVNESTRGSSGWRGSNSDTVSVALEAGWNTVGVALAEPALAEMPEALSADSCAAETIPANVLRIDRFEIRTR